ncbi:helix-turn-helix transcriptional regulator [Paracoccus sp. MBLB3053]|uniref:Helix-turn-helix transcriptional regulator n=1 Tax=Paracoccus aurantius TaxID=3073814 RepID=A0ABU2HX50_9RHOB|nr:helix-turn-helix transcriptional regulator [Paracoccus sp. MBLB3053]MDS9469630.1 helix-turn-helix transcriptional regulator [Paracoccus sp. MBLB3053]
MKLQNLQNRMFIPETHAIGDSSELQQLMAELVMSGPLSLERVARHVGTSPRSLQRHLASRSLAFRSLVDTVRLQAASTLLRQTDLPAQEIAGRLGYSTPSNFSRAFVRWTGQTPRQFRQAIKS